MPEVCPLYYWMDSKALEQLPELQLREPGFLMNPRVPEELVRSAATLSFCPNDGSCLPSKTEPGVVSEHVFFSRASAAPRRRAKVAAAALATGPRFSTNASWKDIQVVRGDFESISVLHVHNVDLFNPSERRLPPNVPSMETLHRLTSKVWCNGCPITRQGAMINRLNRSVVHELEQFCRTEARAKLDLGGSITCCSQTSACRACTTPVHKAKVWKEAELSWSTQSWISEWARLTTPKRIPEKWTCSSPLCAGPWT